jgi:hypothetical protein
MFNNIYLHYGSKFKDQFKKLKEREQVRRENAKA